MMRAARLLPLGSKAGFGSGWKPPVTRPPSDPGASSVYDWSLQLESLLETYGPLAVPPGSTIRNVDPDGGPPSHDPAVIRNVPTSGCGAVCAAAAAPAGEP